MLDRNTSSKLSQNNYNKQVCCCFCKKTLPTKKLNVHYLNAHIRPKSLSNLKQLPTTKREIENETAELESYLATKKGCQDNHAKRRLLLLRNELIRRKTNSSYIRIVQGGSPGLKR